MSTKVKMVQTCSSDHDEISYAGADCPCCELKGDIENLERDLNHMENDRDRAESRVEDLEAEVADLQSSLSNSPQSENPS